jgi:hypothetical protein
VTVANATVQTPRGPVTQKYRFWTSFFGLLPMLVAAWFFSIITEWVGIFFWWSDQGVEHSRNMIAVEIGYLNADFRTGLAGISPVKAIVSMAEHGYHWVFEVTGIGSGLAWLGESLGIYDYVMAVPAITQLFFIRLGILIFSLPVYLLAAVAGISTGLTMRDIRRWSAGREFGRVYHIAKSLAPKMLLGAWFIYLAVPVAIHPNLIILPFAVLFGVNVGVMAAAYKKYL